MHTQTQQARHVVNRAIRSALIAAQKQKAEKEIRQHPERFTRDKLRDFCSSKNIPVCGDRRFTRTFVTAISSYEEVKVRAKTVSFHPVMSVAKGRKENKRTIAMMMRKKKKESVACPTQVVKKTVERPQTANPKKAKSDHAGFKYPANLVEKGENGKYRFFRNRESEIQVSLVTNEHGKRYVHVLLSTGNLGYLTKNNVHKKWYVPYPAIQSGKFDAPKWMEDEQRRWIVSAMRDLRELHELFLKRVSKKRHHGGEKVGPKPKQFGGHKREG